MPIPLQRLTAGFAQRLPVQGFALVLLCLVVFGASAQTAVKPNIIYIIYILSDDLGYGDLGSYGQKLIRTPRLDRMAREGMRFTQHYSGAPSCAPSRCVLMTGKHAGHARIRANSTKPLRREDVTVAARLKAAGYVTGGVGKWGLGDYDTTGAPWKQGFDQFFGFLDQTESQRYYPARLWRNDQQVVIEENSNGKRKAYSHDLFVDAALDFIREHKDRPFFLYGAFTIPRAELLVPEDSLAEYRGRWPEPKAFSGDVSYSAQEHPRAARAAMITRLDRDMGRLLDLLDELNLSERTLVIFASDNGPITAGGQDPEFFDSNGPLRNMKFSLYEGGIRVPFIARWPGKVAHGSTATLVIDAADMFPTFAELAGSAVPNALDGVSIVPTLLGSGERQQARPYHYWESAPQQAVRVGDWKLYRPAPGMPVQLYDLGKDVGETRNVAAEHPEVAARLTRLLTSAREESKDFPLMPAVKKK